MPSSYTRMANRPHVVSTSWIATVLRKRSTWHFDAWLVEADNGVLWFRTETSEGGIHGLALNWYRVTGDGIVRVLHRDGWPDESSCHVLSFANTRLLAKLTLERLNRIHWQHIVPMIVRPRGYKWQSVALHYVAAASLDPLEGSENWHRYSTPTGRVRSQPEIQRLPHKGSRVERPAFVTDTDYATLERLAKLAGL